MPPLPDVPDVFRARVLWSDSADLNVSTTLYFEYSGGPPSVTTCNTLAADLFESVGEAAGFWLVSVQLVGVIIEDLSSDMAAVGSHAGSVAGTLSGQQMAGATSLVANYAIARRYRGGKPRSYLPWGGSASLHNGQQWDSTFLGNVLTAINTIFSEFVGTTVAGTTVTNHANVSYYQGSTAVIVGPSGSQRGKTTPTRRAEPRVDAVVGVSLLGRPGSQRRRNRT